MQSFGANQIATRKIVRKEAEEAVTGDTAPCEEVVLGECNQSAKGGHTAIKEKTVTLEQNEEIRRFSCQTIRCFSKNHQNTGGL
jgi:hypothetical protein